MKNLLLLLVLLFLLISNSTWAQTAAVAGVVAHDTINLSKRQSLTEDDFKFEINRYISLMQRKTLFRTYDDYIVLVRLFNTIEESAKYQKQAWMPLNKIMIHDFYTLFRWNYMDATIRQLAFEKRTTGSGYYSAYFKLGIGLTDPPKDGDFYQVTW